MNRIHPRKIGIASQPYTEFKPVIQEDNKSSDKHGTIEPRRRRGALETDVEEEGNDDDEMDDGQDKMVVNVHLL